MDAASEQFPAPEVSDLQSLIATPGGPTPSTAHRIFIGPYGLRAGWSLLIFVAMLASILTTVRVVHDYNKAKRHQQAVSAAVAAGKPASSVSESKADASAPISMKDGVVSEGIAFAAVFVVSLLMALIERRRVSVYGLGGERPLARFFVGACWGLAALSLLIGILRALHLVSFDAQLDHGWTVIGYGALALLCFLFVGLLEEYLFRGYLQFTLTRGLVGLGNRISPVHGRSIAFWMATLITSALFFLAHTSNNGEDLVGLALVFVAGVAFVVALWRTGSLWWAIGFHMAWDWAQSFLYGVPDSGMLMKERMFATHASGNPVLSGGTVGPEGSVLCIPVLALMIVVLLFTRKSPGPPLEQEARPVSAEPVAATLEA